MKLNKIVSTSLLTLLITFSSFSCANAHHIPKQKDLQPVLNVYVNGFDDKCKTLVSKETKALLDDVWLKQVGVKVNPIYIDRTGDRYNELLESDKPVDIWNSVNHLFARGNFVEEYPNKTNQAIAVCDYYSNVGEQGETKVTYGTTVINLGVILMGLKLHDMDNYELGFSHEVGHVLGLLHNEEDKHNHMYPAIDYADGRLTKEQIEFVHKNLLFNRFVTWVEKN